MIKDLLWGALLAGWVLCVIHGEIFAALILSVIMMAITWPRRADG